LAIATVFAIATATSAETAHQKPKRWRCIGSKNNRCSYRRGKNTSGWPNVGFVSILMVVVGNRANLRAFWSNNSLSCTLHWLKTTFHLGLKPMMT